MSSRRRLLRVICSSDEEDEEIHEAQPPPQLHNNIDSETLNLQGVTLNSLNSNPTTTPTPSNSVPIEISDEDFMDASDDLFHSPPVPAPRSDQPVYSPESSRTSSTTAMPEASDSPISRILEELGLRLRTEWLDSCLNSLQTAIPGFSSFDSTKKAKLCFEKFLNSDMNNCGAGLLPANVHQMHLVDLPGPFVLQVDEIVNISQPLRDRYKKTNSGLKRCLKLSMTDGVQRVFGMEYQPIKDLETLAPAGLKVAISNVNIRHGLLMLVPEVIQVLGGLVEELDAARQRLVTEVNKPPRGKRTRTGAVPPLATRATRAAWPADNNPVSQRSTPIQVDNQSTRQPSSIPTVPVHREHVVQQQPPRTVVNSSFSNPRENIDPFPSTTTTENSVNIQPPTVPIIRENDETSPFRVREEPTEPVQRAPTVTVSDDEDVFMAFAEENHSAVGRSSESPFTYLAHLSVKWAESKDNASHVEGKIKCIVTGVKGFQYKRSTYELHVYVDDGSLISEILIDHNVVQKRIGYSPEEVNTALASSDPSTVTGIKDIVKQFQVFLVNFEGTMVVRLNEASSFPVAVEMEQGCPSSDAWLLLTRLKSSSAGQRSMLDPIDLSP